MRSTPVILAVALISHRGGAQAVRPLGPVVATTGPVYALVSGVRELSDGSVLLNASTDRLIVKVDARLQNPRVIIDSVGGRPNSYGARGGGLFPGLADTTLFLDRTSQSMMVLDANGAITRVMALPAGLPAAAIATLTTVADGVPTVSARHGFVFRGRSTNTPIPSGVTTGEVEVSGVIHLMRMNMTTRVVDTVATLSTGTRDRYAIEAGRQRAIGSTSSPFRSFDDWTVASDGSIAILRGQDYRIDWFNADGTRSQSPRISYPWRPISADEKTRLVDSMNAARKKSYEDALARRAADSAAGRGRVVMANGMLGMPTTLILGPPVYFTSTDIPDYYPAVVRPAERPRIFAADAEDRVWVMSVNPESTPTAAVYDVIDRKGTVVDRVRLPEGRYLLGFGRGVVYLLARDGGKAMVEKARFK